MFLGIGRRHASPYSRLTVFMLVTVYMYSQNTFIFYTIYATICQSSLDPIYVVNYYTKGQDVLDI